MKWKSSHLCFLGTRHNDEEHADRKKVQSGEISVKTPQNPRDAEAATWTKAKAWRHEWSEKERSNVEALKSCTTHKSGI